MGRRGLSPGEAGEIETTPQVRNTSGRWVATDNPRKAQRHRARVYYGVADQKRPRDISVTADKKSVAIARLEVRLAEVLRGANDGEMTAGTPLVVAGEMWLALIERPDSGKSARTVADYTSSFRRCIDQPGSSLRGLTLAQANDPQRLGNFLRGIADERGTGTAKMCRSVLSGILNLAVDNGVITSNAILNVRAVRSRTERDDGKNRKRAFTREERDAVIAHADSLVPPSNLADPRSVRKAQATADLLALMAGTGARIDEARSLVWDDVDLAAGTCHLRGTKSGASDRTVNLPAWLLERLQRRQGEWETGGYVVASPAHLDGQRKWDQSNSAAAARKVLDSAGASWAVPHTFRRTVATLLHAAGVPLVKIADQLGHTDPAMTARIYFGRDSQGDKSDLAGYL